MRMSTLASSIALLSIFALGLDAGAAFIRADFNTDAKLDISDPVGTLGYLFKGEGSAACLDAGDANDDGTLDISDAVFSLLFLFGGGQPPAAPYPACGDDRTVDDLECITSPACAPLTCGDPTPAATEGPYYKAGSPERSSLLEDSLAGMPLSLSGFVLSPDCEPLSGAWLDFWQANSTGAYDNAGFTLRGHQFADAAGRYALETIVPGIYPGRTEHIHVKVRAPDGPILTTQLFFPGSTNNEGDGIFREELLITIREETDDRLIATFNFVVQPGG